MAAKFKDAQEGQLSCISHSVRVWKERKGRRRKKAVATKWPTLSMFLACLLVFAVLSWAPWKDSLWSLSEKWCQTVAEIDACLLRINSINQQGNVLPFLCASVWTVWEVWHCTKCPGGSKFKGQQRSVCFFVKHFSLAKFHHWGLKTCKATYNYSFLFLNSDSNRM